LGWQKRNRHWKPYGKGRKGEKCVPCVSAQAGERKVLGKRERGGSHIRGEVGGLKQMVMQPIAVLRRKEEV